MRQTNLSVFIPHLGCPNNCSFCNQRYISGTQKAPDKTDVIKLLDEQAEVMEKNDTCAEIAFFGGSFTAISRDYMIMLLETAKCYIEKYPKQFIGIRCSTRPDCIDEEILGILKKYDMTAIELGAQSMNDNVLRLNDRGHSADDVRKAAKMIKDSGFELGLQMMTGLYGDKPEYDIYTADEFINLGADTVRIYPTVVLKNTRLCELMEQGLYKSYGFDETVDLCAKLLKKFEEVQIPVIRLGLHASTEVENEQVSGVYHPALRELCINRLYFSEMKDEMEKSGKSFFYVYTDRRNISKINGQKRCNKEALEKLGLKYKIVTEAGTRLRIVPVK